MSLLKRFIHLVWYQLRGTLHSTMSLLKLVPAESKRFILYSFTFHYVSIKTSEAVIAPAWCNFFTFHYVSIKTCTTFVLSSVGVVFTFHYVSIKTLFLLYLVYCFKALHSTMSLLKRPMFFLIL